ncbi:acyl-CoA thioesterase [Alicyclobacillus macrosporangiidus]|uniref:Acyl-CoA hydrolase n=1 Tax=Alicyclobacillus macrosporangiidus TaxID=392015 RepID=A0A1I7INY3_9BACL|nr:acyl-CoA thioesterase [Alicyclobacillus macrosporangiidus]SFU74631.1 Acyl-CoA hydrolase [Alicyclobacillus macrosporangiidus]
MDPKPCRMSRTVMTDLVLPPDTNNHGTIFGGNVMRYIDKIASIACMRHARKPVVTASSDSLDFLEPIRVGEAVRLEAFVTWTHKTSMEVFVRVESENLMTGEVKTTARAYLTFVAIGPDGRPTEVPPVYPETDEERHHYETAPARYELRRQRKLVQRTKRDPNE